jgi:hypothetical protein
MKVELELDERIVRFCQRYCEDTNIENFLVGQIKNSVRSLVDSLDQNEKLRLLGLDDAL